MQYAYYTTTSPYVYYTDPDTGLLFRDGLRDLGTGNEYVVDKEIMPNGFDLDLGGGEGEGVGWTYVGGMAAPGTTVDIRDGARDLGTGGEYVVDREIIPNGFDLDLGSGEGEGVGWTYMGGAV